MKTARAYVVGFAVAISAAGCAPRISSIPPSDPAAIMIARPDAQQARACAPGWVEQALLLLNEQSARIRELDAR